MATYDLDGETSNRKYSEYAESSLPQNSSRTPLNVRVDDDHPFDIDAYMTGYSNRNAAVRLLFIARNAPRLHDRAIQLASELVLKTKDVKLYGDILSEANSPHSSHHLTPNHKWVEETTHRNTSEKDRLEVDLKTYTTNLIKESIRMSHRDLGDYHRSLGEYNTAIKHYTKSREYCTTGQHILEMCLSVLELIIEQQSYTHISTYVFKAESALEAPVGGGASANSKDRAGTSQSQSQSHPDREKIQAKLDYASGLAYMASGAYDKAAYSFAKLGKGPEDWYGKVQLVAPSDIAIYATLCALASLSRSAVKATLVDNEPFGYILEQEPYVREILDAYMNSKFQVMLALLNKHSARHLLDIHLSPHVNILTRLIKNRGLILYFQPFASVRLDKMAAAFGLELHVLEREIVGLIEEGQIKARVDSQNKILKAKDLDHRSALFTRAVNVGSETQASTRKLLLRLRLIQADLIVKAPKGQNAQLQQQDGGVYGHGQMVMVD